MSEQQEKINKDVEAFLKNGGEITVVPQEIHTVQSIKKTYVDNPKNDFKHNWSIDL